MISDYYNLLHTVYHLGDTIEARGLKTKELTGVRLEVDKYNFFSTPECRSYENMMGYLYGELCWYLSGERDITNILPYSKFWASIRNADNTANSNYGDLVFYRKNSKGMTSYQWALTQLQNDPQTRKAIILYNDRELFYHENKDLICNQYQHFLIRNDELICFVGLRSSDMVMGLQNNIPWWSFVHQQMLMELKTLYPNLKLGKITAFISSAHIYENKWSLVEKVLSGSQEKYFIKWKSLIPFRKSFSWYKENLNNYLDAVKIS